MAKNKFEYVKDFELKDSCLQNCWIVVRVDGKGFHKFADIHGFAKPNDIRGLNLMSRAAKIVMDEFQEVCISYGQSDEYSFVLRKDTTLYNRSASKILTHISTLFTSAYVLNWPSYFGPIRLKYPPSFDARLVLYPTDKNLRDYLSWRQADVHVNNLYNTVFWGLVIKCGLTKEQAEERLQGTVAADKIEILYAEFGMNYNIQPIAFRKGTILLRQVLKTPPDGKLRQMVVPVYTDMNKDVFWKQNPEILGAQSLQMYPKPDEDPISTCPNAVSFNGAKSAPLPEHSSRPNAAAFNRGNNAPLPDYSPSPNVAAFNRGNNAPPPEHSSHPTVAAFTRRNNAPPLEQRGKIGQEQQHKRHNEGSMPDRYSNKRMGGPLFQRSMIPGNYFRPRSPNF